MPVLATPKRHLRMLGIFPVPEHYFPESLRDYRLIFNCVHILFIVVMMMCYSSAMLLFPIFKANTFDEYSESVLFCSVAILRVILYVILFFKKSQLLALLDELDEIVEKSKIVLIILFRLWRIKTFLGLATTVVFQHMFSLKTFKFKVYFCHSYNITRVTRK